MDGRFREWLAGFSGREIALVLLVAVAALGGGGLWYIRSLPRPVEVRAAPVAAPAPSPSPAILIVHVAGRVRHPGVYELRQGARIVDALEAAGGPKGDAALDALNLAALLTDGQQVLVPGRAEARSAATAPVAGVPSPGALVNVNTAGAEELETLPGIGEVLAATIIAYRDEHGPFTSVEQLLDVSGIGEVTLEELRDLVTV